MLQFTRKKTIQNRGKQLKLVKLMDGEKQETRTGARLCICFQPTITKWQKIATKVCLAPPPKKIQQHWCMRFCGLLCARASNKPNCRLQAVSHTKYSLNKRDKLQEPATSMNNSSSLQFGYNIITTMLIVEHGHITKKEIKRSERHRQCND